MISHDRYFLRHVCDYIVEMDGRGGLETYLGNYEHYLKARAAGRENIKHNL